MTTKANKFGLRAAAAERSNRHAQRTPLPPRPGVVEAAREPITDLLGVVAKATALVDGEASDARSLGKAQTFASLAVAAKWQAVVTPSDEGVEVTATRGAETIVQAWSGGVWEYESSIYAYGDRNTKPRNASGARKLLGRTEEDAAAEMSKVLANNSFRKREPVDLANARPALPFDRESATDEQIFKAVNGQAIVWYNRISRGKESAIVSPRTSPRMTYLPTGERILNWCCPVTGFRSAMVDAILQVGRGKAVKNETLAIVELEDAA
jgi:hypothetical protein